MNHAKTNTKSLPEVPDVEVVEKELWEIPTAYRKTKFRKALLARGFKLARQCYYHPTHWLADAADNHMDADWDNVYEVIDEVYLPLTDAAKAWLVSHNEEMDRLDREDVAWLKAKKRPLDLLVSSSR